MPTALKLSRKNTPLKLSQETKDKISVARIRYLKEHPDQVPYLLNHSSKGETYPEKYFNEIFKNNNIKCKRYVQYGIYNLDFVIIDKLINIEIDGNQHISDKIIVRSNERRDIYLSENGWTTIRILWSDYMKLNHEGRKEFIDNFINVINDSTITNQNIAIELKNSKYKILTKKHFCSCGNIKYRTSNVCIDCRTKIINNENKPTKEELIKLINDKVTWTKMGKMFNVSDNGARKWAKGYNLI